MCIMREACLPLPGTQGILPPAHSAQESCLAHACCRKCCAEVFQGHKPVDMVAAVQGRTVESVGRKGKYFWFSLGGDGPDLLMHFGMTGYLMVRGVGAAKYVRIKSDESWPPRFTKLELTFSDGAQMAFMDARRCGSCYLRAVACPRVRMFRWCSAKLRSTLWPPSWSHCISAKNASHRQPVARGGYASASPLCCRPRFAMQHQVLTGLQRSGFSQTRQAVSPSRGSAQTPTTRCHRLKTSRRCWRSSGAA